MHRNKSELDLASDVFRENFTCNKSWIPSFVMGGKCTAGSLSERPQRTVWKHKLPLADQYLQRFQKAAKLSTHLFGGQVQLNRLH